MNGALVRELRSCMLCRAAKTWTTIKSTPCIIRLYILFPLAFQASLCLCLYVFLSAPYTLRREIPSDQIFSRRAEIRVADCIWHRGNNCRKLLHPKDFFFPISKFVFRNSTEGGKSAWEYVTSALMLVLLWWLGAPWSRGDGSQMMFLRRFADLKSGICENLVRIRGMCLNRWYVKNIGIERFSENL